MSQDCSTPAYTEREGERERALEEMTQVLKTAANAQRCPSLTPIQHLSLLCFLHLALLSSFTPLFLLVSTSFSVSSSPLFLSLPFHPSSSVADVCFFPPR